MLSKMKSAQIEDPDHLMKIGNNIICRHNTYEIKLSEENLAMHLTKGTDARIVNFEGSWEKTSNNVLKTLTKAMKSFNKVCKISIKCQR